MGNNSITIEKLELSNRLYNCLKVNGVKTLSDLLDLSYEEIVMLKGVGEKLSNELLLFRGSVKYKNNLNNYTLVEDKMVIDTVKMNNKEIIKILFYKGDSDFVEDISLNELCENLSKIKDDKKMISKENFIEQIYQNNKIHEILSGRIKEILRSRNNIITDRTIKEYVPNHLKKTQVIDKIIAMLIRNKEIEIYNNMYRINYPTIIEVLDELSDIKEKHILKRRIEGKALELIGEEMKISKQRVGQIQRKVLQSLPSVREDRYRYIFQKYNWSKKSFMNCFNECESTYEYLKLVSKKGKLNICNYLLKRL